MIKLLHTADIHLDSPLRSLALRDRELQSTVRTATRNVFRKIIDLALAENVSALLLCGDVFDSVQRSAQTLAFFNLQLDRLQKANIPVFYIKGNHDAENPLVNMMEQSQNIKIFSSEGDSFRLDKTTADGRAVYIHGVSFSGKKAPNLLNKFSQPEPHAVNIGLLHTSLNAAKERDVYAPCSVADLAATGYDYWALGHIHKRAVYQEKNCLIVMPGIPQGRDIGEEGAKSVTLTEIGNAGAIQQKEHIICDIAFQRLNISVADIGEADVLRRAIAAALQNLQQNIQTEKAAIRLILEGKTPLYWQIVRDFEYWRNIASEAARNIGNIWIDKLELNVQPPQNISTAGEAEESVLPVAELSGLMRQMAEQPELRKECAKSLEALLSYLPPEARSLLVNAGAAEKPFQEELLRQGGETVTALLETYGQSPEQPQEEY